MFYKKTENFHIILFHLKSSQQVKNKNKTQMSFPRFYSRRDIYFQMTFKTSYQLSFLSLSSSQAVAHRLLSTISRSLRTKPLFEPKLHGPSMFAVKAKIYGVLYNQASSIAFDETSSFWSALKSS